MAKGKEKEDRQQIFIQPSIILEALQQNLDQQQQAQPSQAKLNQAKPKELSAMALIPAKLLISIVPKINAAKPLKNKPIPGSLKPLKNSLEISLFVTFMLIGASSAQANLRQDCLAWASSSGAHQQELANRIGTDLLLTKNNRLEKLDPDHPQNLYRSQDIQRVCRGQ